MFKAKLEQMFNAKSCLYIFIGMWVLVCGNGHCHWIERKQNTTLVGGASKKAVVFEGKAVFLKSKADLFAPGALPIILNTGVHKYTFQYRMPYMLPQSLRVAHGEIEYRIEVVFDISGNGNRLTFYMPFQVVRYDSLPIDSVLMQPQRSKLVNRFFSIRGNSRPLIMVVSLSKSGFFPGEIISVGVSFDNQSNVEILQTKMYLNRIVRYHRYLNNFNSSKSTKTIFVYFSLKPHRHTKYEIQKITEHFGSGVKEKARASSEIVLVLPEKTFTSNSIYCGLIQISYKVTVEAEVKGFHRNVELTFPITIISKPPLNDEQSSNIIPDSSLSMWENLIEEHCRSDSLRRYSL